MTENVALWNVEAVGEWLTKQGYRQYEEAFVQQQVTGPQLLYLSEEELIQRFGMDTEEDRHKLLFRIAKLKARQELQQSE